MLLFEKFSQNFVRIIRKPDILGNTVNLANPSDSDNTADEFEFLLASHQGRLFGFIRSLMGAEADIEDVLQNTNRVIWEKADSFEPGSNFRAWAFQIARYQVLQFRDGQRRDDVKVPFSDEMIESLAVLAEEKDPAFGRRQKFLCLCLEKMPDRQRSVIEKRYFDGLSVIAIGEQLGMKANAVSQLLYRGRENLLRCIEGQMPSGEKTI